MTSDVLDDLLPACPGCGYSLHGLPVQHRCPECGLGVDRRWKIFGGRGASGARMWSNWVVAIGLGANSGILLLLMLSGAGQRSLAFVPVLVILFNAYLIWMALRKPTSFIALGVDDITVVRPRRVECFVWGDVHAVRLSYWGRRIVLDVNGRKLRMPIADFFSTRNYLEAERCVRAINDRATALRLRQEILSDMENEK